MRQISGEGKNIFAEEKESGEGEGGKYHGEAKFAGLVDRSKALQEVLVDLTIKSSSTKHEHDLNQDALIVCTVNSCTSMFAGTVSFFDILIFNKYFTGFDYHNKRKLTIS